MESLRRSLKSGNKLPKNVDFHFEFKNIVSYIALFFKFFESTTYGPPAACSSSIKDK